MKYAKVAVNTPVDATFDYHIPPELEGKLQPGHLVQVQFRTAMDHAIVLSIHDEAEVERTKPVIARLDPRPVVTRGTDRTGAVDEPGLSRADGLVRLDLAAARLDRTPRPAGAPARQYAPELVVDPVEEEVVALLKRRGELRGHQLNLSLPGKNWRAAVEGLAKYEVVTTESVLSPPRVRPRMVQTAALAIHPDDIPDRRARSRTPVAGGGSAGNGRQPAGDRREGGAQSFRRGQSPSR